MITKPIAPVNVRRVLAATPSYRYAKFWLQPQVCFNGQWQGGEVFEVKRISANEFLCVMGERPYKTLEQAAQYVEELLTRYGVPYIKTSGGPCTHPYVFQI